VFDGAERSPALTAALGDEGGCIGAGIVGFSQDTVRTIAAKRTETQVVVPGECCCFIKDLERYICIPMKRQPEPALRVRMLLLSLRPPTVTAPDRGGGSNLAAALFIQRYLSVPQRGFAPYSG